MKKISIVNSIFLSAVHKKRERGKSVYIPIVGDAFSLLLGITYGPVYCGMMNLIRREYKTFNKILTGRLEIYFRA